MASWRDSVSEQAADDLDALVDAGLSTAEDELRREGAFHPFAVARTVDGETQLVGVVDDVVAESPDPVDLVGRLWDTLQDARESFRAAGVVTDRTLDGDDQVAVQVEHAEGRALEVTLAYRLDGGRFQPGALAAGDGIRRLW